MPRRSPAPSRPPALRMRSAPASRAASAHAWHPRRSAGPARAGREAGPSPGLALSFHCAPPVPAGALAAACHRSADLGWPAIVCLHAGLRLPRALIGSPVGSAEMRRVPTPCRFTHICELLAERRRHTAAGRSSSGRSMLAPPRRLASGGASAAPLPGPA